MWISHELWLRRCRTLAEAAEAVAAANADISATSISRSRQGQSAITVRRLPRLTRVISDGVREIVVTARISYGHETDDEYSQRFHRNNLPASLPT